MKISGIQCDACKTVSNAGDTSGFITFADPFAPHEAALLDICQSCAERLQIAITNVLHPVGVFQVKNLSNGQRRGVSGLESLEELEKRHILNVLERCGGQKSLASRTLGIERSTLDRKLKRYANGAAE